MEEWEKIENVQATVVWLLLSYVLIIWNKVK